MCLALKRMYNEFNENQAEGLTQLYNLPPIVV